MFEGASGAPAGRPALGGEEPLQLAQAAGEPIGSVEELAGTVTLTHTDGSTATAAAGDPVFLNDTVATSPDGSVEILFVDGTRFSLGQDGQMRLDQLVYDPGGSSNELDLSVVQGAFTFVTGAIAGAPGEGMEVNVPVGTIGIRGTAVGGGPDLSTPDPTDYTIVLLPEQGGRVGQIVLTDRNGRSVILDQALEAMDISSLGLAPGEPVQLTRDQVLDLLGIAVENLEDILEEIQNLENLEEQQNPEAGPQQRGDAPPSVPNNGGINTPQGETRSLDELTTLFSLSDEQGLGRDDGGPIGGFTPTGGLGDSGGDGAPRNASPGSDGPAGNINPVPGEASPPPASALFLLTGGEGDDILDASDIGAANIVGLGGNDTLIGSSQDDILQGGGGDDILDAGAGNDQVFGGGGNDLIIGGSGQGDDHLDGGAGIDTVKYSSATQSIIVNLDAGTAAGDPAIGHDTLVNIENVIGGQGNDIITGNGAANRLEGGSGDDVLTGLGGNDTIIGGAGNDVAVFTGNRDNYEITGAEGGFFVADLREGGDGTDFVAHDVEALRFADQEVMTAPDAKDDIHVVGESPQEVINGAAMKTTVTVAAGAVLRFQYNFLDSEPANHESSFTDFAVLIINGQAIKLADVGKSEIPAGSTPDGVDQQTGYQTRSFVLDEAGTYVIGFAVLNEGGDLYNAGLLIDNVSITSVDFSDGFESGVGGWETIGSVSSAGIVEGIPAPGGSAQASLVSNGASSAVIEQFLGVAPGTLSAVGNQPVVIGNVLDNDGTGGADVTIAGIVYAGNAGEVNTTTANGITTILATDGAWKLEFDLSTGAYVFTVLSTLEHPGGDVLSFPFTYTIEGVTGLASSATLTILVNDGVPNAIDDLGNTAIEGGEAIGGNVLSNDGFSPDGAWVTSITVDGETYTVPGGEPREVVTPRGGTLVIAATGDWTYAPPATVEGTGPVSDDFTYTVTDSDGDTSSALVGVTVAQGSAGINGTPGDDILSGTPNDDEIRGFGGDDFLSGLAGDDTLDGGDGIDAASYAAAASGIHVDLPAGKATDDGQDGTDTLIGIENVVGSAFDDHIIGDALDNLLVGAEGSDFLNGVGGDDVLVGTGGIDTLIGGPGGDILIIDDLIDMGHTASIDGGEGFDTLFIGGSCTFADATDYFPVSNVERIDLTGDAPYGETGTGANTLRLDAAVVHDAPGGRLEVFGDKNDTVELADTGWESAGTVEIDGRSCNVFTFDTMSLYVSVEVEVNSTAV